MDVHNICFNWRSSFTCVVTCTKYLLNSRIAAMSLLPTAERAGGENTSVYKTAELIVCLLTL